MKEWNEEFWQHYDVDKIMLKSEFDKDTNPDLYKNAKKKTKKDKIKTDKENGSINIINLYLIKYCIEIVSK